MLQVFRLLDVSGFDEVNLRVRLCPAVAATLIVNNFCYG